jgi:hypothetical protein
MRKLLLFLSLFIFSCQNKGKDSFDKPPISSNSDNSISQDSISNWDNLIIRALNIEGYMPQFIDENQILYTSINQTGLWIYNLASKESKQICDKKGAGYKPMIIGDTIVYQVRDKVRFIESFNISTNEIVSLKNYRSPKVYIDEWNLSLDKNHKAVKLSDDLKSIQIIGNGGIIKSLEPQRDKNYLDVSYSPNKKMLAYTAVGIGGFITDLDGEVIHELGDINSPSWIDNEHLLYYESTDDGHHILSSEIYIQNLTTGRKHHLSKSIEEIVEFPSALENGKSVIAQSANGKIYIFDSRK